MQILGLITTYVLGCIMYIMFMHFFLDVTIKGCLGNLVILTAAGILEVLFPNYANTINFVAGGATMYICARKVE